MLKKIDVHERFSNGSVSWRASVLGQFAAKRKLQELTEHSENEFVAVDILSGEPRPTAVTKDSQHANSKVANGWIPEEEAYHGPFEP